MFHDIDSCENSPRLDAREYEYTATRGHQDVIRVLHSLGANMNTPAAFGMTALMAAA
jgi:hypothetical protein